MTDQSASQPILRFVFRSGLLACVLGLLLFGNSPVWGQDQAADWQKSGTTLVSGADARASYIQSSVGEVVSGEEAHLSEIISIYVDGATLEQALRSIAEKGDLELIYGSHPVLSKKRVTLNLEQVTAEEALREATQGTGLEPVLSPSGKVVLVNQGAEGFTKIEARGADFKAKPEAVPIASLAPLRSKKQQGTITGTVTDSLTGEPLPGVNVVVVETQQGAATNAEGSYTISGVEPGTYDVEASFVGYARKTVEGVEVREGEATAVDFALVESAVMLDEIVAIGYGEQRRSDLTGAVGRVDAEALQQRSATTTQQALAGRVAGVNVSENSGRPGGNASIRIRGNTSISSTNEPLYVVDGVILNVANLANATSPIDYLEPANIESIEVLKDASATAIYGSRGANGVVLITTKGGGREGPRATYDTYLSTTTLPRKLDVLNSEEFLRLEEIAFENAEKFDPNGTYVDPRTKRTDPRLFDSEGNPLYDTDWQEESSQSAITHNHQLSFSGGDNNTNYGVYLGLKNEDGLLKKSYLNRYSGRVVVDSDINDWITAGGSINYNVQNESQPRGVGSGGITSTRSLIQALPITPVRYPDGSWGKTEDYPGMEGGAHYIELVNETGRILETGNMLGNAYAEVKLTESIDIRSSVGANIINQEENYYAGGDLPWVSRGTNGEAYIANQEHSSWQLENYITYDTDVIDDHSVTAILGASWQQAEQFRYRAGAQDFLDDYFRYNNLGVGSNPRPPSSEKSRYTLNSYFSRVNYTVDGKYLFTLTGRIDGSSRFGNENKYAFFPSAALGWLLSEEPFLNNSTTVSTLKIRASYGVTGNSEIPNYRSFTGLGNYSYILNGEREIGIGIDRMANPNLRWERNSQMDVGLELGLLNDRITLEADVYRKVSSDMLLNAPVPTTSGYTSVMRNIGSMENRGIELLLSTVNVGGADFSWVTDFNVSMNRNKVIELTGGADIIQGGNPVVGQRIIREGEPVNSFWGFVHLGTWNTDEEDEAAVYNRLPGDVRYMDVNNDGAITDEDRVIIGNGEPDAYGSVINNISYKNFNLTVDLQFMYGNDVNFMTKATSHDRTGITNVLSSVLDAWTPDNQDTPVPQVRPAGAGLDRFSSTDRIYDGSFIRGRNIVLGYNFPQELARNISLNNLRVYASVKNAFIITRYPGYDPEVSTSASPFSQGMDLYSYPKPRSFMVGINAVFD